MVFRMRARPATPGGKILRDAADDGVSRYWQRNLLNSVVADGSFETTASPAHRLFAFDNKESNSRSKRRGTIYECFENFGLRFLLVYVGNSRFHDRHIAGGLGPRRLGGSQLNAALVSSVQMLSYGSDQAAVHLHIGLA